MRIDFYARPNHRREFTDFMFHGYITAIVAANSAEEEKELSELERFILPDDDWYGGEVERIATLNVSGEIQSASRNYSGVPLQNYSGVPIDRPDLQLPRVTYGDCRACWYFSSLKKLKDTLEKFPPKERPRREFTV